MDTLTVIMSDQTGRRVVSRYPQCSNTSANQGGLIFFRSYRPWLLCGVGEEELRWPELVTAASELCNSAGRQETSERS